VLLTLRFHIRINEWPRSGNPFINGTCGVLEPLLDVLAVPNKIGFAKDLKRINRTFDTLRATVHYVGVDHVVSTSLCPAILFEHETHHRLRNVCE
jgi:hypothetical protein